MTNFLGALSSQLNNQYSLEDNSNHSVNGISQKYGKPTPAGLLGSLVPQFDPSTERRYVEEGYLRNDPYTTSPKQFEVLFQEPNATIFIKKKMFSSVSDNYRPDYMNANEKLYYKTMKVLFQNKCAQIAALERLSKIERISSIIGSVPNQIIPIIIGLTDQLNASSGSSSLGGFGVGGQLNSNTSAFTAVVDRLRRAYGFSTTNQTTTWISDSINPFQFGKGTGTIEITNFKSFNTTVTTDINSAGNFSLFISDPYEAMLITEWDIEKAISDATNMYYNNKGFELLEQTLADLISQLTTELNQLRTARNVSTLTFQPQSTILSNVPVIAVMDKLGVQIPFIHSLFSVTVPPAYYFNGSQLGPSGLNSAELSLFSRIISTIFSKVQQDQNAQTNFQTQNELTNYTRRKLRFQFSGKLIIQPMDVVHIYISSKSRYDSKVMSGLQDMFSGLGTLQNLNNSIANAANSISTLFNPSGNIPFQVEKAAYVGSDFPNFLWSLVRDQFVTEKEGVHVFAGLVESAPDNWSDGKFSVEVLGKDNTYYFEQGKINFKPGVDAFNGSFFDPLTPFESNFDTINSSSKDDTPTLLQENQIIFSLVKNKLGRYAGQPLTQPNIIQDKTLDPVTGRFIKTFYAPDGLVYTWKEGIGVFTQFGSNLFLNDPSKVGNPNIFNEPFAGQDVMNVLSLLITGLPYNFATYFKSTQNLGNYGTDPQSKQNAAHSFTNSLRSEIAVNNTLWGNFIPFKSLVIDEASFAKAISQQTTIVNNNSILNKQIQDFQKLNQQAMLLGAVNALSTTNNQDTPQFANLSDQIKTLQTQITSTQNQITQTNMSFNQSALNDTSTEASDFIDSSKIGSDAISNADLRRDLRRQINYLTRRMSYDVRSNQDKNLFIVDDSYDKDFDIMAYNQALTDGIKLYNNEFTSVKEKIAKTAQLLNLEVFADTQGHIRVRPPQYNKMPSSVFYRMLYLKQVLKIQVFPNFLNDLFDSKLDTLRTRLEILEDQIRLDCAYLGYTTDASSTTFINSTAASGTGSSFDFISTSDDNITDFKAIVDASQPGQQNQNQDFTKITDQATSNKTVLNNSQRYTAILQSLTAQNTPTNGLPVDVTPNVLSSNYINTLVNRIQTKSAQKVNTDYLVQTAGNITDIQPPNVVQVDIFKVIQDLSDKLSNRQQALKLLASALVNAQEFKTLTSGTGGSSLQLPGQYGNSHVPETLEHMIEDETYDDYGVGSGSRYIIRRSQILNISISENAPPWTSVEVQGIISPFNPNGVPPGLNSFPGGGNGVTTALAIDYDMWRNYGFKNAATVQVPFLSDSVSQCGPYATMLLSRNRKEILKGSITMVGNEYMQPGEVVFLEDRGLLFYVSSVKHSFTFPSSFTTTLELTYGHSPGEYIPTVMDTIGKLLYNNKDVAEMAVQRQDTSGNELSVGVVQLGSATNPNSNDMSLSTGASAGTPPGAISASNAQVLNNILFTTAYQINANNSVGNNATANLELRIYHDKKTSVNSKLQSFANAVQAYLAGQSLPGLNSANTGSQGTTPPALPSKSIKVTVVNLDETTDRKSPSQKAIDLARNLANSKSTTTSLSSPSANSQQDSLRTSLFTYIVDCWVSVVQTPTQEFDPGY
jgi:hypothetical protein